MAKRRKALGPHRRLTAWERYKRDHPGDRCNARTRSGGRCVLTLGHSFGHRKAL